MLIKIEKRSAPSAITAVFVTVSLLLFSTIAKGQDLSTSAINASFHASAPVVSPETLIETISSMGGQDETDSVDHGWWQPLVSKRIRPTAQPLDVSLESVLIRTLNSSSQIKVFSELPLIRETSIIEADSAFDWTAFLDTRWNDLSDPVGSTLTVGGAATRYENEKWTYRSGLRRKNRVGGQVDIGQQLGWQETNSNFFVPNPQGTARLVLAYTQPIMRGRGKVYNESLTVLATIDKKIADQEFQRQLQSHLLEVTRAYWALYMERGVLFQKTTSYQRAQDIYQKLERRRDLDAQQTQIISAEAAVTQRQAELLRAKAAVKNSEARLRALVNDIEFATFEQVEIIPTDSPTFEIFPVDMQESMTCAIQYRPEIIQAIKQIRAAGTRLNMAKHELLPILNLVTEGYVAGLKGNGSISDAFEAQYNEGRPSYSVGFQYEYPIRNRAAIARTNRRRLELRQLQYQYQTTLETVKLEVEISVREVETSGQEMFAKQRAMNARAAQLEALNKRWINLPGEDVTASLALENLLEAQVRLTATEFEFLQAQVTYNLALMNLKRAAGLLLKAENIHIRRVFDNGFPQIVLDKPAAEVSRPAETDK